MSAKAYPLYSSFYDTIRQREYVARIQARTARAISLRARLRFDWLLHGQITLTDNQWLDGGLLLPLQADEIKEIFPKKLFNALRRPALLIKSPAMNAEEALIGFVRKPKGLVGPFEGFDFSILSDENNSKLKEYLKSTQGRFSERATLRHLSRALIEAGISRETVMEVTEQWNSLCTYTLSSSTVRFQTVRNAKQAQVGAHTQGFLQMGDDPPSLRRQLLTPVGNEILDEVLKSLHLRGAMIETLGRHLTHSHNDSLTQDILTIRQWFNRCFNRSEALRLGCDFESVAAIDAGNTPQINTFELKSIQDAQKVARSVLIKVPTEFLVSFALQSARDVELLFLADNRRLLNLLQKWWVEKDVVALRRVIDGALQTMDTVSMHSLVHPWFRVGHRLLMSLSMSFLDPRTKLVMKTIGLLTDQSEVLDTLSETGSARGIGMAELLNDQVSSHISKRVARYGLVRAERARR